MVRATFLNLEIPTLLSQKSTNIFSISPMYHSLNVVDPVVSRTRWRLQKLITWERVLGFCQLFEQTCFQRHRENKLNCLSQPLFIFIVLIQYHHHFSVINIILAVYLLMCCFLSLNTVLMPCHALYLTDTFICQTILFVRLCQDTVPSCLHNPSSRNNSFKVIFNIHSDHAADRHIFTIYKVCKIPLGSSFRSVIKL